MMLLSWSALVKSLLLLLNLSLIFIYYFLWLY